LSIKERTKIYKQDNKVVYEDNNSVLEVDGHSSVSMNFWCFHPSIFKNTELLFEEFLNKNNQDIKSEFFIPIIADHFITESANKIKVIPTQSQWFGVTYKEDASGVKEKITRLVNENIYPKALWA